MWHKKQKGNNGLLLFCTFRCKLSGMSEAIQIIKLLRHSSNGSLNKLALELETMVQI